MGKTAAHAQCKKKREKTKMADEGRVSVNSKQTVLVIHEKLKKEVHEIAEKKSWTVKQKAEFEKKLLEVGRLLDFPCRRELINLMRFAEQYIRLYIVLNSTLTLIGFLDHVW